MKKINTFFLRVAARCNLSCEYCYVFKHRDTTWNKLPPIMNIDTLTMFCERLSEYSDDESIYNFHVIFHGGEPLVIGKSNLIHYVDYIKSRIKEKIKITFSLQTNGTLLNKTFISECAARNIGISVSLDGPEKLHNLRRRTKAGKGTFKKIIKNIDILKMYPEVFDGVIGVINPYSNPQELLSFYKDNELLTIDLLLPDSTYQDPPVGKETNRDIYKDWLIKAFDTWFNDFQDISFRTYELIIKSLLGEQTNIDTFGLGELDYLTIETDGSLHTTDILKISYNNASSIGLNLSNSSIRAALSSNVVKNYNDLLSYEKLPRKCKVCEFAKICGGGSLPHRFSKEMLFDNPSVYCYELFSLILHIKNKLDEMVI